MKKFIFSCLIIALTGFFAYAQGHLYSTSEILEPDKLSSIWLIKRFVDKDAQFKFYSSDELISEGVPFDVPQAELRISKNTSTFESIVKKFNIIDPKVKQIAEIIHDIEINYWGKKIRKESEDLNRRIIELIETNNDRDECIRRSFIIFDGLYQELH